MKTLTALLLICFISVNLFSQDTISKISFGIQFTPHLSNLNQNWNTELDLNRDHFDKQFKVGWTTGVIFRYSVLKNLLIETGLNYSNKGYSEVNYWDLSDSIRDLAISMDGKYPEEWSSKYNTFFLDIPLSINYNFYSNRKLSCYGRLGFIMNHWFYSTSTYSVNYNDGTQETGNVKSKYREIAESSSRRINLSSQAALGLEFNTKGDFRWIRTIF